MTPHSTILVVRNLRNGRETEFDPPMNQFLVRAWSPDGRHLVIAGQGSDGVAGARVVDLESGVTTLLAPGGTFARPDWLADGRVAWLERSTKRIIARDLRTGGGEVLFDLSTQGSEPIAEVRGRGFRISPDGHSLAYTSRALEKGVTIHLLTVLRGGVARVVARDEEPLLFQDWLPDGSGLLFTRWRDAEEAGPVSLWLVNADGGEPKSVRLSAVGLRDVSVSPDGNHLTFTAGWPLSENLALDLGRRDR